MQIIDSFVLSKFIPYPYEPKWLFEAESAGKLKAYWLSDGGIHGADDPMRQSYVAAVQIGENVFAKEGAGISLCEDGRVIAW